MRPTRKRPPERHPGLIDPPTADAGDEFCHLAAVEDPGVAVCGSRVSHHPGVRAPWDDRAHCPVCGRPACPVCVRIFDVYNRSGAWEGP